MQPQSGFPAYLTDQQAWDRLHRLGPSVRHVVLNANSGPGPSGDELLAARAAQCRASGQLTYGYVSTSYGRRSFRSVAAEIRRWKRWYDVDGVFIDEAEAGPRGIRSAARAANAGRELGLRVVLNPGAPAPPALIELADLIITFENTAALYRSSPYVRISAQPWVRDYPSSRFWHLIYGVRRDQIASVRRLARRRHADVLTLVELSDPLRIWAELPDDEYFPRLDPRPQS